MRAPSQIEDGDKDPRIQTRLPGKSHFKWADREGQETAAGDWTIGATFQINKTGKEGLCHTAETVRCWREGGLYYEVGKGSFFREVSVLRPCGPVGSIEELSDCQSPERPRTLQCVACVFLGKGRVSHHFFAINSLEGFTNCISKFSPSPFYFKND